VGQSTAHQSRTTARAARDDDQKSSRALGGTEEEGENGRIGTVVGAGFWGYRARCSAGLVWLGPNLSQRTDPSHGEQNFFPVK
jgi:hypothetical protein